MVNLRISPYYLRCCRAMMKLASSCPFARCRSGTLKINGNKMGQNFTSFSGCLGKQKSNLKIEKGVATFLMERLKMIGGLICFYPQNLRKVG